MQELKAYAANIRKGRLRRAMEGWAAVSDHNKEARARLSVAVDRTCNTSMAELFTTWRGFARQRVKMRAAAGLVDRHRRLSTLNSSLQASGHLLHPVE